MTSVLSLCALGLLAAFLLKVTDELSPRFKPYLLCGAGILFFLIFLKWLFPLFLTFQSLIENTQQKELFLLLLKALALSFLISFSTSFCRDLGEEKMAEKIELGGKAALLSLSLPVLQEILNFLGVLTS